MSKNNAKKTESDAKNTLETVLNTPNRVDEKAEKGQASTEKKVSQTKKVSETTPHKKEETQSKSPKASDNKPSLFSKLKGTFIWLIVLITIATALFVTRKDLDWQVEHINNLQAKVAQLTHNHQALEARLDAQLKEVDARLQAMQEALNQPENQAAITQADIEQLQQSTQQQLARLQDKLGALSTQASEQVKQVISSASELAKTTENVLQPSEESKRALAQIEANLQSQLTEVTGKLAELFDFKTAQQAQLTEMAQKPIETVNYGKMAPNQVEQWVAEINTQWLLRGNVTESRAQLQALQAAISVSQIDNASTLNSLIMQDLVYLEAYQATQSAPPLDTLALKQAIQALDSSHLNPKDSASTAVQGGESLSSETAATEGSLTFDSAVEQLKQTLSSMVSIKKRDAEQEVTQVESLILHDVLIQRALLLVDRMDWAIVSHSTELLQRSAEDLQAYIDQTFPKSSAEFQTLLTPFLVQTFEARKPLAIVSYQVAENAQ